MQNTALVLGGTKGLGRAIVQQLPEQGYRKIFVLGRTPLDMDNPRIVHIKYDASKDGLDVFEQCSEVDTLIVTAGTGRLAPFETFTRQEIQNTFQVNAVSTIQAINFFYNRLKGGAPFYCAIVSSISGAVSSPLFSLYAATKASLYRFTESVNIELEKGGSPNRILNVCPGNIPGTSFYGGESDIELLQSLAAEILGRMKNRIACFIPRYDEVYSEVLDRYRKDSRQFGLESYDYKIKSGRVNENPSTIVGYLSGTFDLFHIGHLNILKKAKEQCDYLVVGVHKDASHKQKEVFVPFEERCEILKNIKHVDKVIVSKNEDIDVYEDIKYDVLFVGSDYKGTERFERYEAFLKDKNVKIVYFPYTKDTSSTKLRMVIDKAVLPQYTVGIKNTN